MLDARPQIWNVPGWLQFVAISLLLCSVISLSLVACRDPGIGEFKFERKKGRKGGRKAGRGQAHPSFTTAA
jgi:hypothetical protein